MLSGPSSLASSASDSPQHRTLTQMPPNIPQDQQPPAGPYTTAGHHPGVPSSAPDVASSSQLPAARWGVVHITPLLVVCLFLLFPLVNYFTATACKISGLKSAHIHACRQCIWWSYNKSTFITVHFDSNPFTYSPKALMISNLALLLVVFQVMASQARQWKG